MTEEGLTDLVARLELAVDRAGALSEPRVSWVLCHGCGGQGFAALGQPCKLCDGRTVLASQRWRRSTEHPCSRCTRPGQTADWVDPTCQVRPLCHACAEQLAEWWEGL